MVNNIMQNDIEHEPATTPEDAAEYVLKNFYTEDLLPINPELIAKNLGIDIQRFDDLNLDGALIKLKGKVATIFIRGNDPILRERFTIAHEIGHYADRHANNAQFYDGKPIEEMEFVDKRSELSKNGTDRQEVFANKFAAALLMPKNEIEIAIKNNITDLKDLAKIFKVSVDAMYYRLRKLGHIK
jgi:Zn-dependent peptidase ImmA (M78 family)